MYGVARPRPREKEGAWFEPVIVHIVEPSYRTNSVVTVRRVWPVFLPEHSIGPPLTADLLKLRLHLLQDRDNLVAVARQPARFMRLLKKFVYKVIMVMALVG